MLIKLKSFFNKHSKLRFIMVILIFIAIGYVIFRLWYDYNFLPLQNKLKHTQDRIQQLKRDALEFKSEQSVTFPEKYVFKTSDLINSNQTLDFLRHSLKGDKEFIILSLTQKSSEAHLISKLFKKSLSLNSRMELNTQNFELKALSHYHSLLILLKNLNTTNTHIFWDTVDYNVTQYPKAIVTLTFHTLGKPL